MECKVRFHPVSFSSNTNLWGLCVPWNSFTTQTCIATTSSRLFFGKQMVDEPWSEKSFALGSTASRESRVETSATKPITRFCWQAYCTLDIQPPRGSTSRKIVWGCAARFLKPLPYFRPKSVVCGIWDLTLKSIPYCWFSHDVTKTQTKKMSILPRFYFHDALEQLKTNFHTNFRFKRVLGFVIEYAWISKLLRDSAFTWRPRELLCRLKKWLNSGNFAIYTVHV